VPDSGVDAGRTVVLGERELAIGFRLIGFKDVIEVTPSTAASEFRRIFESDDFSLVIASQSVAKALSESQRQHAEASLRPLVVFVPPPSGEYEIESLSALAKRVLGVSLAVPG
jgi:V/A-type H+/Na+-transporting ATPase subunit F